jgi:hypothetical protein
METQINAQTQPSPSKQAPAPDSSNHQALGTKQ